MNWTSEWTRAKSVRLQGSLLIADIGERYNPFDGSYRNLPGAFGKVTDAESACAFVRKYGPLGYSEMTQGTRGLRHATEPLDWFLNHAKCVRFALAAFNALYVENRPALAAALSEMKLVVKRGPADISFGPEPRNVIPVGKGMVTYYGLAERGASDWVVHGVSSPGTDWDSLRGDAQHLVTILVNENAQGVRRVLDYDEAKLRILRNYAFDSLLGVIWHMMGDVAVASQQETRKGIVRKCECDGCPGFFLAHDLRQRFCPPEFGEKESLCAVRNRMRRRRERSL